ncbi:MAG: 30S ribosomal protein S5 [Dehalococcoidia bacterium]|jgi:small subunit ribosomal protein S5|nr:30S ribosomal protein S5 [Dehalococcoidia bacterium]MDW8008247.1 30S ribosomal protein S5 [Chloroflexota bacterium]
MGIPLKYIADRDRVVKDSSGLPLQERTVYINRVAKMMAGGRRFHFTALVVVGDGQGHVGAALGKATEVPEAIRKASNKARQFLIRVPLVNGTIPHPLVVKYGASRVIIKPAPPGTGLIAGGAMRPVLELAGVKDAVCKALGSTNPVNLVKATIYALSQIKEPEVVRALRARVAAEEV